MENFGLDFAPDFTRMLQPADLRGMSLLVYVATAALKRLVQGEVMLLCLLIFEQCN
jgi:hypothetical protein